MKRSWSVVVCLIMVCSLVLSACSGSSKTGSQNQPASTPDAKAQTSAAAPEPAELKETIRFMTSWVGTNTSAKWLSKMLADFESKYPNIKIKVEEVPGAGQELEDKLKVLISARDFPDVTTCKTYETVKMGIEADVLVDVKPYIQQDQEWYACLSDEANRGYNPVEGKWYAFVSQVRKSAYFYNKDIYAKAGIEAPAKTWEELFEQAEKIKAAGYIPFALQGQDGGWLTNSWLIPIVGTMNEDGYKFANTMFPTNFENPEFIKGVETVQMMFQKYASEEMVGNIWQASAATFLTEKSAIIAQPATLIQNMRNPEVANENLADRVGFALFPGDAAFIMLGDAWLCGAKGDNKLKASLIFLKHMSDKEAQISCLEMASLTPVDPTIDVESLNIDPLLKEVVNITSQTKIFIESPHMMFSSALWPTLSAQYSALAFNQITPAEFAKIISDEAKKLAE